MQTKATKSRRPKKSKAPRNPARVAKSKFNAFRNKQRQRNRHALRYPNDHTSLANAKRWVEVPDSSKSWA